MSTPTVLYLGASRGVAFNAYVALATQRPDLHHVLLLRSISRFEGSPEGKSLTDDIRQRTTFFEGDARVVASVQAALRTAGSNLYAVVSSIGFRPRTDPIGLIKGIASGFKQDPPDFCCSAFQILVIELQKVYAGLTTKPKLVLVSSMGMGIKAHHCLAFGLGPMYSALLTPPHVDKIGMEVVMEKVTIPSSSHPRFFPDRVEAPLHILTDAQYEAVPAAFLPQADICVPRLALLSDAPAKGWGNYRVIQEGPGADESKGKKMYSIYRSDAGEFIGTLLAGSNPEVSKWWGCQPVLAY